MQISEKYDFWKKYDFEHQDPQKIHGKSLVKGISAPKSIGLASSSRGIVTSGWRLSHPLLLQGRATLVYVA